MPWYSPNFTYWSQLDAYSVDEATILMRGVDPRAFHEYAEGSPGSASSHGESPDLTDGRRLVQSGVQSGKLTATQDDKGMYINKMSFLPWLKEKGFHDLATHLKGQSSTGVKPIRPLQASAAQRETILAAIKHLGHDPVKLPKGPRGKDGIRKQVRGLVDQKHPFTAKTSFDKMWC